MNTIYHWLGIMLVWGTATLAGGLALRWLWQRRPRTAFERRLGNAWTWMRVFIFGKRWLLPREGAYLLLTIDKARKLDRWERDTLALMIRYNHRKGWRPR